jgi:hypothetical protein
MSDTCIVRDCIINTLQELKNKSPVKVTVHSKDSVSVELENYDKICDLQQKLERIER